MLRRVQQFEPAGVAARNLRECCLIQLAQLPASLPLLGEAKRLVGDYLDLLGSRDYAQLMRRMKIKEDELKPVIELIQTLHRAPARRSSPARPNTWYRTSSCASTTSAGWWSSNQEAVPRLRVNPSTPASSSAPTAAPDNTYMRTSCRNALVHQEPAESQRDPDEGGDQIVEHQRGFLEYGEEAMKPLVLHDIAEAVGMHESTISRVTTQKFMPPRVASTNSSTSSPATSAPPRGANVPPPRSARSSRNWWRRKTRKAVE